MMIVDAEVVEDGQGRGQGRGHEAEAGVEE